MGFVKFGLFIILVIIFVVKKNVRKRQMKSLNEYFIAHGTICKAKIYYYEKNDSWIKRPPSPIYTIFVTFYTNDNRIHNEVIKTNNRLLDKFSDGDEINVYCIMQYYENDYDKKIPYRIITSDDIRSIKAINKCIKNIKNRILYKQEMMELLGLKLWNVDKVFFPIFIVEDIK